MGGIWCRSGAQVLMWLGWERANDQVGKGGLGWLMEGAGCQAQELQVVITYGLQWREGAVRAHSAAAGQ